MLIRREDFGNIEELSRGSDKKIWFTCDVCGIGILQRYGNYVRQKNGKLCKSCRQKSIMNKPERKLKSKLHMKKQWQDELYRKKISKSLSKGCKKAWERDNGTRRKIVSENTSKVLKEKWKDKKFYDYQVKIQKETHSKKEYVENAREISKKLWDDDNFKKQQFKSRTGKESPHKHSIDFIKKEGEKRKYILLSKKYNGAHKKLKWMCSKNHIFYMTWNDIRDYHGCPYCSISKGYSYSEKEISDYLKSLNIDIIENDRSIISPLELDIVIPSHKLAIEYCGLYWHSEKHKNRNYHKNKMEKCNQIEYRLITIFEDEWLYKQEIVKSRLKYFLNLNKERIYARRCIIREISRDEAKKFVNKYHIQGHINATIYLGAFYDMKTPFGFKIPELVAVNTFVKRGMIYELNRFCVNKSVIGIASKFIKYFQRNYEWKEIITFADLRWSEGDLYEKIGFIKDKELNPDYSYFKNETIRYHKFLFRHNGMKSKLENYDPNLSERENMKNNGWLRIYDCGKIRYSMKRCEN